MGIRPTFCLPLLQGRSAGYVIAQVSRTCWWCCPLRPTSLRPPWALEEEELLWALPCSALCPTTDPNPSAWMFGYHPSPPHPKLRVFGADADRKSMLALPVLALASSSTVPQCDADDWEAAAARVRAVAARAFDGYAEHAWGRDELRPVSNRSRDNWGGLAVTMVDSLDTLLLMGLTEQYKRARDWLVDNLPARLGAAVDVPFFEVVIRCLGGLLGAHTLSGDVALLDLAEKLGDKLLRAFDSPSGLPFCTVNLAHGNASCPRSDFGYSIPLAELGSVQLEFGALAVLLGRPEIAVAADGALRTLRRLPSLDGLYPSRLRPHSGGPAAKDVGFGSGVRHRHPNYRGACRHAAPGLVSLPASTSPSTLSLSAHPHPHLYTSPSLSPTPQHLTPSLASPQALSPSPRPKPHRSAGRFLLRDTPQAVAADGRQPAVAACHAP